MRVVRWIAWILLALGVVCIAALLWYRQQSLPVQEGSLVASGIGATAQIARDQHGIPTINARSEADALFALGFAHAQDRLWQLAFNRRIAQGRLAEILGPAALETDRFLRTIGIYRHAERLANQLDADTATLLAHYVHGVNAGIGATRVLPPEFLLTRAPRPEPWRPADSIAWLLMMAWDLSAHGYRNELARLRLSARFSAAEIADLRPPYPGEKPLEVADYPAMFRLLGVHAGGPRAQAAPTPADAVAGAMERAAPDLAFGRGPGLGSNNWVVAGSRTISGKPLLANDPHLGLSTPSVWYFARIQAPELEVVGATLPGVPYVIIGRTPAVAWGLTNTNSDVQDLYLERRHPADAEQYQVDGGFTRFDTREELIRVRGAADVRHVVRQTRNGPVLSDVLPQRPADGALALALRWTALEPTDATLRGLRGMNRARSAEEFEAALRDIELVQQNIVFADTRRIAMIAPGRIPLRRPDNDLRGLAPAPGWEARYQWQGWLAFEQMPRDIDPPRGYIVTANHRITPPGYPHFITSEWYPPYRAHRIEQLLAGTPRHDAASMRRIQGDVVSLAAREQLAALRALPIELAAEATAARVALERLYAWDGTMQIDRPEGWLLQAWLAELRRRVFADDLGDLASDFVARSEMTEALTRVLRGEAGARDWCDDIETRQRRESCAEVAGEALEAAIAELGARTGADVLALRWGDVHPAVLQHRPLSNVALLRRWFELSGPAPGDSNTVNVGQLSLREPGRYPTRHAATLRFVADLADPGNDSWILGSGQSGHPWSPHYGDQFARWLRAEALPVRAAGGSTRLLELTPTTR